MLAAYAAALDAQDPIAGLMVGERPDPTPRDGWVEVAVKAASLNHHDLWTLRGVGIRPEQLPTILGGDAAGIDDDGNEVIVHSVISSPGWTGDETLDPRRALLSEVDDGTLAEKVLVPRRNLVRKPPSITFEEAACLPTGSFCSCR
jgi:NADPH:quinone reductase-like Zn-dependent oxidoreductase